MLVKEIRLKKCIVRVYKYNNVKDYRMTVSINGILAYDIGTNYNPITKYSCLLQKCIFIVKYLKHCKRISEKRLLSVCRY